jgi:hypothetical protein
LFGKETKDGIKKVNIGIEARNWHKTGQNWLKRQHFHFKSLINEDDFIIEERLAWQEASTVIADI